MTRATVGISRVGGDPSRRRWLCFLLAVVAASTVLYSLVLNRRATPSAIGSATVEQFVQPVADRTDGNGSGVVPAPPGDDDDGGGGDAESQDDDNGVGAGDGDAEPNPADVLPVELTSRGAEGSLGGGGGAPGGFRHRQHGRFTILFNYVVPDSSSAAAGASPGEPDPVVTYTTHGEFTFVEHLPFLAARWAAPVSMALYVPGTDFEPTLASVAHVRWCHPEVKRWISFHLVFEEGHFPPVRIPGPADVARQMRDVETDIDCSKKPWKGVVTFRDSLKRKEIEKRLKAAAAEALLSANGTANPATAGTGAVAGAQKLPGPGSKEWAAADAGLQPPLVYPINVIRNAAREAATTPYVLASDVELYPSLNFARDFATMVAANPGKFGPKVVFPMPIFEVKSGSAVPETKDQLLAMLKRKEAVPFHASVCPDCHRFPFRDKWMADDGGAGAGGGGGMSVLGTAYRTGPFKFWEPIYVGTNAEPPYDERLSWEGKKDKMTQMYALCAMNYEFAVLNNAFLVHSPGIKVYRRIQWRDTMAARQTNFIRKVVEPELIALYGSKPNCRM